MCHNIFVRYKCYDEHDRKGEDGLRLMEIRTCEDAQEKEIICVASQRLDVHDVGSDDPDNDCPECQRATPPATP